MAMTSAVPALPVSDVPAAVQHYAGAFGFRAVHVEAGFAVLERDDVRLHLWHAGDSGWGQRPDDDLRQSPVRTGAETFLAGTASCRVALDGVDALLDLYGELAAAGVLHPVDTGEPRVTDFGTTEFATGDLDGNLLEFYVWTS